MIDAQPGDILLCHRKGFVSSVIRWGERLRFKSGARWSHAAFVVEGGNVVEALTRGVVITPLSHYDDIEHEVIHTHMDSLDVAQAIIFALSCVGQEYGFLADTSIALRFLTPGRGLWFGTNGTELCSGLCAQAATRGWAIYPVNPASMSPAELAEYHGVRTRSDE